MEKVKNKEKSIEGWRKAGIAMGSISALVFKDDIDFKIAVIIGIIAVWGILCQTALDWCKDRRKELK